MARNILLPLLMVVLAFTITHYYNVSFAESASEEHTEHQAETVAGSEQDTHVGHQETVLQEEQGTGAEDHVGEHNESEEEHHEHVHETGEGPHVHNSATAETAQWVGVGTLIAGASLFGVNTRARYRGKGYRLVVMALAVGAGIMHLLLVPDHLADVSIEHARFFAGLGAAQISFGILFMIRPTKRFAIIGIVGNIGSIILYWVTRIENLPEPFGAPEGVDTVGIVAKIVEMSLVGLLIYLAVHYRKVRFLAASRA